MTFLGLRLNNNYSCFGSSFVWNQSQLNTFQVFTHVQVLAKSVFYNSHWQIWSVQIGGRWKKIRIMLAWMKESHHMSVQLKPQLILSSVIVLVLSNISAVGFFDLHKYNFFCLMTSETDKKITHVTHLQSFINSKHHICDSFTIKWRIFFHFFIKIYSMYHCNPVNLICSLPS